MFMCTSGAGVTLQLADVELPGARQQLPGVSHWQARQQDRALWIEENLCLLFLNYAKESVKVWIKQRKDSQMRQTQKAKMFYVTTARAQRKTDVISFNVSCLWKCRNSPHVLTCLYLLSENMCLYLWLVFCIFWFFKGRTLFKKICEKCPVVSYRRVFNRKNNLTLI